MAKVTKEKLSLQLAFDVNSVEWKTERGIIGRSYDENLTTLLAVIALCGRLALKNTADGEKAAWLIAHFVTQFVYDPEKIRAHFRHATFRDAKPDDQADDQAQFNTFVLRALRPHAGLLDRLRQMIFKFQEDNQLRCYSPIGWKRYWPWVLDNIFGGSIS